MVDSINTDVLIIGSGIAGLFTALSISKDKKVVLVSKARLRGSNSYYAQGGVAVVFSKFDNVEKHKQDTLDTGLKLSDEKAVEILVKEGPERIKDLIRFGVNFDKNSQSQYELRQEGAHSERRILHVADKTGNSIENALIRELKKRKNIQILEKHFLDELICQDNQCFGAVIYDAIHLKKENVYSNAIVLATGGAGQVYEQNTNWIGSTGDGLVAAYSAGATIRDMEFYQFHPTAIQLKKKRRGIRNFLISEAVRGEGAIVVNSSGERFLFQHDSRGELASRDIVSRAILNEIESGANVYLDLTKMKGDIPSKFPVIYKNCLKAGLDITTESIQIVPVAHYMIGGILTNTNGATSITGLYSCGESACVGVHGANRLASNSLLECMVFGYKVASSINALKLKESDKEVSPNQMVNRLNISLYTISTTKKELQNRMYRFVGIKRTHKSMKNTLLWIQRVMCDLKQFDTKKYYAQFKELVNLLTVAELITTSALKRKESRGAHYRIDYPELDKLMNFKHTDICNDH